MSEPAPRCGDQVLHRPTGERWLVAWADPTTNDIAWAGWPNGLARLSDCETIWRCTDERHAQAVDEWRRSRSGSDRRRRVLAMYGTDEERA